MKVRPERLKKLPGNNMSLARDKRSNKEGTIDLPGGAEHIFILHQEPRLTKYEKGLRRVVRKQSRESEAQDLENG